VARHRLHGLVLLVGLVAVTADSAVAQEQPAEPAHATEAAPPAKTEAKPWATGVSAENQQAALSEFHKGNEFFAERRYALAMQHYRTAVGHWEHPAIHFNMTVCLIHMDQPIDALRHIGHALAFEAAPLGDDLHAQALTYNKLLRDRLGHLTVTTRHHGAKVSLDGKPLLDGPATQVQVLMPGRHQIVATLDGHVTHTEEVDVVAGEPRSVDVALIRLGEATEYERPMSSWVPWAVMGSGALVALVGLGVRSLATARLEAYDRGVAIECPQGCATDDLPASIRDDKQSGELLDATALVTMGVGGAGLLTGLTLLVLNSPRPVERSQPAHDGARLSVSPQLARDGAHVGVTYRF